MIMLREEKPALHYLVVVHGEGNDPAVVTICSTPEEREQITRKAIYEGDDNEEEWQADLQTLRDSKWLEFEGDPPVQWIDAEVWE